MNYTFFQKNYSAACSFVSLFDNSLVGNERCYDYNYCAGGIDDTEKDVYNDQDALDEDSAGDDRDVIVSIYFTYANIKNY